VRFFSRIFVRTWGICAGLVLVAYLIGAATTSSQAEEGAMNFGPLIVWLLFLFVLFITTPAIAAGTALTAVLVRRRRSAG
jgi:hypothetical protein